MNKIILLAIVCTNVCLAQDRIGQQPIQPLQFVIAVGLAEMAIQNPDREVVLNEAKPKHSAQPTQKKLQQKQKFPKQKKINVHQPRR